MCGDAKKKLPATPAVYLLCCDRTPKTWLWTGVVFLWLLAIPFEDGLSLMLPWEEECKYISPPNQEKKVNINLIKCILHFHNYRLTRMHTSLFCPCTYPWFSRFRERFSQAKLNAQLIDVYIDVKDV